MKFDFVKVGACTPDVKVADVEYNCRSIIENVNKAYSLGVEVLCFPEMAVTGYTVGDLVYSDVLLNSVKNAVKKIEEAVSGKKMLVFFGAPIKKDGCIYDVAVAMDGSGLKAFIPKTFLQSYNDGYEERYFVKASESNGTVLFDGREIPFGKKIIFKDINNPLLTVGAEIGSDLFAPLSPSTVHSLAGANVIVNCGCMEAGVGKNEMRLKTVCAQSQKCLCGYVYAESGNGESTTDAVFGGHDVIAEKGKLLAQSKLFLPSVTVSEIDLGYISFCRSKAFKNCVDADGYSYIEVSALGDGNNMTREFAKSPFMVVGEENARAKLILETQTEGLKKRIEHTSSKTVVIGLSGGLDSTLAILVAVEAVKKLGRSAKGVIAVTMPCFGTTSRTYENTLRLARSLGVTLKKIDITKSVERHFKDIKHPSDVYDVTFENSQARERTQVLMDVANMNGGLVVGTGDLSELALGWATYNGDHMSMYAVNASIPKTLVRVVVNYYASISKGKLKSVLADVLSTPVSPELLPAKDDDISQKTEDIVGPYDLHDFFIYYFVKKGYSPEKIYYIACRTFKEDFDAATILKWLKIFVRRFFNQQFKRSCVPDGVKVGSCALSPRGDWKMPSDAVSKIWLDSLENL